MPFLPTMRGASFSVSGSPTSRLPWRPATCGVPPCGSAVNDEGVIHPLGDFVRSNCRIAGGGQEQALTSKSNGEKVWKVIGPAGVIEWKPPTQRLLMLVGSPTGMPAL